MFDLIYSATMLAAASTENHYYFQGGYGENVMQFCMFATEWSYSLKSGLTQLTGYCIPLR